MTGLIFSFFEEGSFLVVIYILLASTIIFYMNVLMEEFCQKKEIPEEKQSQIFSTANLLTLILLISSFVEMMFVH